MGNSTRKGTAGDRCLLARSDFWTAPSLVYVSGRRSQVRRCTGELQSLVRQAFSLTVQPCQAESLTYYGVRHSFNLFCSSPVALRTAPLLHPAETARSVGVCRQLPQGKAAMRLQSGGFDVALNSLLS